MDCAHDAREIEEAAASVSSVESVKVSTAMQIMAVQLRGADVSVSDVETAVSRLGYRLEALSDNSPSQPSHLTPAYRRALWTVVLLNVGYGVVEILGGFLARSQSLKADALDFIGDGLITFLALLATGWSLVWRARSALIQGMFLGALGLGVVGATVYRLIIQKQPEAEAMGLLGVVALLVNVAAAAMLIPHRTGDANARAVWLFSRNDAIGNAAIVVAAFLVAWTRTSWPDLAVAFIIAALFLHSAWSIVRDAHNDLKEAEHLL